MRALAESGDETHRSISGIVACSAEGAALCYKTICVEGAQLLGPHAHPEVSMHTPSLADYVACLERGDLPGVADLMLASADKLARIGADFLICPDNTIHEALPLVLPRSPLPWLHIAEVVAAEAVARGFRRLGITGTRWLVDSEVYPEKLTARGLDYLRPTAAERDETNRIIMEELVYDRFKPEVGRVFPARDRAHEGRGVRCRHPRLHRDPADHQRRQLSAADAQFHATARACGVATGGAKHLSVAVMSADARQSVTIALAQTPVSPDVSRNLSHITAMMARAKAAGADLVQFTEGACPATAGKC